MGTVRFVSANVGCFVFLLLALELDEGSNALLSIFINYFVTQVYNFKQEDITLKLQEMALKEITKYLR